MKDLDLLRKEIDTLDEQILRLLNERMDIVKQIGALKDRAQSQVYRPERERAIIKRLQRLNKGHLQPKMIEAIYQEIFAVSRNLEQPQSVAYLGPEGSYSHQAAMSRFGVASVYLALASIEDIFKELSNKEVKYALVPIENNTAGAVGATYDCLSVYKDIKIYAELYMDIHHSFVSLNSDLKDISRIYSHPQGYEQCRSFLESHNLANIEFVASKSTSNAAFLASKDENSAAICSKIAAKLYNVPILFEKIEDNAANKTRFVILSEAKFPQTPGCKSSILVRTAHKPGSLSALLVDFKKANINLTKLESRPIKTSGFDYSFYIDFEGHIDDKNVQKVLKKHPEIVWLGSYLAGEKDGI